MEIFKPSILLLMYFIQAKSLEQFFSDANFNGKYLVRKLSNNKMVLLMNKNYIGLLGEYDITRNSCINIKFPTSGPSPDYRPKSLKTDHCIMVYDDPDCTGNSYKLNPADYALLTDVKHDGFRSIGKAKFDKEILSFGKCESPQGLTDASVSFYWTYTDEQQEEQRSKYFNHIYYC